MSQDSSTNPNLIRPWHRNLLLVTAIVTTLLIAMGGVLCVTQSIRDCPDWPGCFGKVIPPAETGPILEVSHRLLAGLSGLLILAASIAGLVKTPRLPWITYPPLVAVVLLIEVSYLGAQVVLRGLSPGWAAVDVGSALLVVALMVLTAVVAIQQEKNPGSPVNLDFLNLHALPAWGTTFMVYLVLVSGVLAVGKNFLTGCLGWPLYSLGLDRMDANPIGSILRIVLSILAGIRLLALLLQSWRIKNNEPTIFQLAGFVGLAFLVELVIQVLLFMVGFKLALLLIYTISAAFLWGLLVALSVRFSLIKAEAKQGSE